jgi:hypothetical protein
MMDVAASKRKGKSRSVGAAKAMGLVPSMGSVPKVGQMEGRALVKAMPIMPLSAAMRGK